MVIADGGYKNGGFTKVFYYKGGALLNKIKRSWSEHRTQSEICSLQLGRRASKKPATLESPSQTAHPSGL